MGDIKIKNRFVNSIGVALRVLLLETFQS